MASRFGRALAACGLLVAGAALAQQQVQTATFQQSNLLGADPRHWPTAFNGTESGGAFQWVPAEATVQYDPFKVGVPGGNEGPIPLQICRMRGPDNGVHVGFTRHVGDSRFDCYIGWGGKIYSARTDYQVLVNTRADLAPFLAARWTAPGGMPGYVGGVLNNTGMRVCRVRVGGDIYPGKEWQRRCNYAHREKKIEGVANSYEVLQLSFDQPRWFATTPEGQRQATLVTTLPGGGAPQTSPKVDYTQPGGGVVVGSVAPGTSAVDLGVTSDKTYRTLLAPSVEPARVANGAALKVEVVPQVTKLDYAAHRALFFVREVVDRAPIAGGQTAEVFRLRLAGTNFCVDVQSAIYQIDSRIHLWTCHDGANQRWLLFDGQLFSRLQPPQSTTGMVLIDPRQDANQALCLHVVGGNDIRARECSRRNGTLSLVAYQ